MIRGFLAGLSVGLVVALVAVGATILHYEGIALPLVGQLVDGEISHRLKGYVALSEKVAAENKAAEAKRQADVATAATIAARRREDAARAARVVAEADLEKGIANYEKRLADAKRLCVLDADDIDSILHPR